MQYSISQQQLVQKFSELGSWEEKYRHILRLGKTLPTINESFKHDNFLLNGCESNVWFYGSIESDTVILHIYSDAKIVRGLISLICTAFTGLNSQQSKAFDCIAFLSELGLLSHLSPSRGNGIRAIVDKIHQLE